MKTFFGCYFFRKYLQFTSQICKYRVYNDFVRENISSLYYSLKLNIKSPDIAICS